MRAMQAALRGSWTVLLSRGPAMFLCLALASLANAGAQRLAAYAILWRNPVWAGPLVSVMLIGLALFCTVMGVIGALWTARSAMPDLLGVSRLRRQADPEDGGRPVPAAPDRSFLGMAAGTVPPVLALFAAWDMGGGASEALSRASFRLGVSDPLHDGRFHMVYAVAGLAVFAVTRALARLGRGRTGSRLSWVRAIGESCYVFLGVFGVAKAVSAAHDWWSGRAVVHAVASGWHALTAALPGWLGDWLDQLGAVNWVAWTEGLWFPLLMLGTAGLVFAHELHRERSLLDDVARAAPRVPGVRKVTLSPMVRNVLESVTGDVNDRWGSLLDAARLLVRQHPLFLLAFCAGDIVWEVALRWLNEGVRHILGTQASPGILARQVVVGELFNLLVDLGSLVLAAGAYNTLMRRVRAELETRAGGPGQGRPGVGEEGDAHQDAGSERRDRWPTLDR